MILAPAVLTALCCLGLPARAPSADTLDVVQIERAPVLDGHVDSREYGSPTLQLSTASGRVRVWIGRHDDFIYLAAHVPDSTFYWGDDFVISLDPLGREGASLGSGARQWYLRRVLDSSVVSVADSGRWHSPGHQPAALGSRRRHDDWDVASTSSASEWTVELRVRMAVIKPTPAAPRIAFRTYNDQPAGWWSWPAAPVGFLPQRVERTPDLWVPLRLP